MVHVSRIRRFLAGLALALVCAMPATGHAWLRRADPPEVPAVAPLRGTPAALPGETAPPTVFGILTMPTTWQLGDAAAVLIGGQFPGRALQYRIVEALLAEGAAVLEMDTDVARGVSPDSAAAPAPAAGRALLPDLFGALAALRAEQGVGQVVVIGLDDATETALLAMDPEEAARRIPGRAGFNAAIALRDGAARFAPGEAPPAEAHWDERVPLLCAALGWASSPAPRAAASMATRCIASLRPSGAATQLVRVAQ